MDALKYVYHLKFKANIPVYGVPQDLKDFHTTKKDISSGMEVIPKDEFRLHNEDKFVTFEKDKTGNNYNFGNIDDFLDFSHDNEKEQIETANKDLNLQKSVSMFYREESEKNACL